MRTGFSPERLNDPAIAAAEKSLRACMHCGICTATCPTYLLTGDERDSPRGRIVMMQRMLEGQAPPTAETVHHLDRCLTCLACRSACPSNVDYRRLIEASRAHIEKTYRRPRAERLLRRMILEVLTRPAAMRGVLFAARAFAPLVNRLPGRLGMMAAKAGRALPKPAPLARPEPGHAEIALMTGCVAAALNPGIDAAASRVLARRGFALVPLEQAGCCGALPFHLGQEAAAKRFARQAITAFEAVGGAERFTGVVISATGCGAHLADLPHLFAGDADWAGRAQAFAARLIDLSELVVPRSVTPPMALRIGLHRPCSLQHGLRLPGGGAPQLAAAGHTVIELAENHLCCGSAGSYALLQPALAGQLRARKLDHVRREHPDAVASANIGCIDHLAGEDAPAVLHWVEVLDWSEGGPPPPALSSSLGRR